MSRKRNVTVAAVQMKCSTNRGRKSFAKADALVREAAEKGATRSSFCRSFLKDEYFCQERRYEYYEFAKDSRMKMMR